VVSLGIFSGGLPTEACALGSTQPLKMSTRNSLGGEGGRCVELTTNHPSSAERQEIRGPNLPGPPRVPGGLLREYLYLYLSARAPYVKNRAREGDRLRAVNIVRAE
jgi:hypothetical protein